MEWKGKEVSPVSVRWSSRKPQKVLIWSRCSYWGYVKVCELREKGRTSTKKKGEWLKDVHGYGWGIPAVGTGSQICASISRTALQCKPVPPRSWELWTPLPLSALVFSLPTRNLGRVALKPQSHIALRERLRWNTRSPGAQRQTSRTKWPSFR